MTKHVPTLVIAALVAALTVNVHAETRLPSIFGSHMVLQRDMPVRVWGWDDPGTEITVAFAGQTNGTTANAEGEWAAVLDELGTSSVGRELTISGTSTQVLDDVLVGEVWLCSGQSNMQWPVQAATDPDLESLTAKYPQIRLITVPAVGTQEPQDDFNGQWELCTPDSVKPFSAVGYYFGRQLHQTLDVPIGLIDNAWGGSAAEAWVSRGVLEADPDYKPYMDEWRQKEDGYDFGKLMVDYEKKVEAWKTKAAVAEAAGERPPNRPRAPRNIMKGQHRPGNLYAGVLHPIIGYGIRGAIWYQGETNSGRGWNYRKLFPLMITHWRRQWGQGEFPFYWVQLADFRAEVDSPGESSWAELRESQTLTLSLLNSGQAVITDLGEGCDIHPKNKQDVAKRLARWALAKDYGINIVCRSPEYRSMKVEGNAIVVTLDHVGGGLDTFDVNEPIGFAICGEDKVWRWATAKIQGKDRVRVWNDDVASPVAVRYAWADNPVCNLQNREGLPATPFRTDDFPLTTKPAEPTPAVSPADK